MQSVRGWQGSARQGPAPTKRSGSVPLILGLTALALAGALPAPVQAASRVIVSQGATGNPGSIYMADGLRPGHRYRLDLSGSRGASFSGNALEQYVYVVRKRLVSGTKVLTLRGTAPHSFQVIQPVKGKLSSWSLTLSVQTRGAHVRASLVDLGK